MALNREVSPTVGDIFDQYLKELAIAEFPRGNGKWRNNLKWDSDLLESKKDISAELFTIERLLELSYQKPFHKEVEWSSDAKLMLKEAIKYPRKARLENIHRKFKSLRMVNRNITNVDEYISKFENLEELILSANKIKFFNTKILPRSLRILELCGNKLNDNIGSLCTSPPSHLQHIGLSHNSITSISNFIPPTQKCWESLLSLDLSFNNLENLFQTVDFLKRLPKLRNLHLIGNPVYLFIGYRGYIVDSIKTLAFLDEVNISAHERYLFKGMDRLKNLPTSAFCVINLKLDDFKGTIKYEPIQNAEEVLRTLVKYHVELTFTKDCTVIDVDDLNSEVVEEANTIDEPSILIIPENNIDHHNHNKVIKSNEFSFMGEELEFKFSKYIVCTEMKQFTQLLSNKIEIRFIQKNITMSNEPTEPTAELVPNPIVKEPSFVEKIAKRAVSKMKRNDSVKSVSIASMPKGRAVTKLAKPKKSKVNFDDLRELTRTNEIFSAVEVDCQSILNGSFIIENDCLFIPLKVPETEPESEIVNMTPLDRVKKKMGKFPPKQLETIYSAKSAAGGMKTSKVEAISEEPDGENNMEILQETTEPPSLHFSMEVIHWNTAKEGFDWIQKFGSKFLSKAM